MDSFLCKSRQIQALNQSLTTNSKVVIENRSQKKRGWYQPLLYFNDQTLSFIHFLIGYRQFMSALSSSGSQNFSTVLRSHSGPETVLVHSFPSRWLKCSFHCQLFWGAKIVVYFIQTNFLSINLIFLANITFKTANPVQTMFFQPFRRLYGRSKYGFPVFSVYLSTEYQSVHHNNLSFYHLRFR